MSGRPGINGHLSGATPAPASAASPSGGAHAFTEIVCNAESVQQVNRPRSSRQERAVSCIAAVLAYGVTIWILINIVAPLVSQKYFWRYKYLLSVLGVFALYMSVYVFQIGWGAFMWTRKYRRLKDTDWHKEWSLKYEEARQQGTADRILEWTQVHHYVIVTAYKEPISMLKLLAYSLMSQRCENICKHQITLVLALEEREGSNVQRKTDTIFAELAPFFYEILATYHPPDIDGDIKGKASNYKWAVQEVEAHIKQLQRLGQGIREENCIIHVADADSLYDPNYFPNVTYHFCVDPDRYFYLWQPCMIPTCNLWETAAPCRQVNMMIAAQEMMSACDRLEFQIPFSTYGLALKTLQITGAGLAANAQDGDVITEDHHLFIKTYFATDGRLRVHPIFLPCLNFAVGGEEQSWCSNVKDRFVQAKRHMFGISELMYFIVLLFRGKWCRRRTFGCCKWIRTFALTYKLVKIHSIPYLGLWVTMGLVFSGAIKVQNAYCAQVDSNHWACIEEMTAVEETIEAYVFTIATGLTFVGSQFIIISFVRMLRATHHTLINISDPNGSFMDSGIWEMELSRSNSEMMPGSRGNSPLLEEGQEELTLEPDNTPETSKRKEKKRGVQRPRRPIQFGGGVPWLGGMLQLSVEFVVFGFVTSVLFGSIPAFIALKQFICGGHRLDYVTAPKPGVGPPATGADSRQQTPRLTTPQRSPQRTEDGQPRRMPTRSSRPANRSR